MVADHDSLRPGDGELDEALIARGDPAHFRRKGRNRLIWVLATVDPCLPAGGSNFLDVLLDLGRERLQNRRWGLGVRHWDC